MSATAPTSHPRTSCPLKSAALLSGAVAGAAVGTATLGAAAGLAALIASGAARRVGVTASETTMLLAGDGEVPRADVQADRARTIDAPAWEVWPWLVQLGQHRAGFYSFEALENAAGCEIEGAEHINPAWQHIAVGDAVPLAPGVGLRVAHVEPGRALVLTTAGGQAPPGPMNFDFSWAFVLSAAQVAGRASSVPATRLHVRERYAAHDAPTRALLELTTVASAIMSWRMLDRIAALSSARG